MKVEKGFTTQAKLGLRSPLFYVISKSTASFSFWSLARASNKRIIINYNTR